MLSRYHITTIAGIVALGIIGNFVVPDIKYPMPWTAFTLVLVAALYSSYYAFIGAARFSSQTAIGENMRFSRYPQPIRYVYDGNMEWAAVPVKGWTFLKTWVNSGGNPALALLPSRLLEQESELYPILRVKFYKLSSRSIRTLMHKRSFNRLFTELGFDLHMPDQKTDVYLGFQSLSLHPDVMHIKSASDLEAYARSLTTDETEYSQRQNGLRDQLSGQLNLWRRIQGSDEAKVIVRREREDEER